MGNLSSSSGQRSVPLPDHLPKVMKRLVLKKPGKDLESCEFTVEENIPLPELHSNEVLIKVVAAPINPSDYGVWTRTAEADCPKTLGNEGCGVVVACGNALVSKWCPLGTKVGFVRPPREQGSYSEYVTASPWTTVFPLPNEMNVEDAASFFVNPYTALGIVSTARSKNSKCFVHTAAASQLGQMIVKLIAEKFPDMTVINVVRKPEQVKVLQDLGAKHIVLTGGNSEWKTELKDLVKKHNAKVAFDAVSGEMTGDLLSVLPSKGIVYLYGGLAGNAGNLDPMDLIYRKKQVCGWLLNTWLLGGNKLSVLYGIRQASAIVNSGLQNGWSSTQFRDTTMSEAHGDFIKGMQNGLTGIKFRIRFQ